MRGGAETKGKRGERGGGLSERGGKRRLHHPSLLIHMDSGKNCTKKQALRFRLCGWANGGHKSTGGGKATHKMRGGSNAERTLEKGNEDRSVGTLVGEGATVGCGAKGGGKEEKGKIEKIGRGGRPKQTENSDTKGVACGKRQKEVRHGIWWRGPP